MIKTYYKLVLFQFNGVLFFISCHKVRFALKMHTLLAFAHADRVRYSAVRHLSSWPPPHHSIPGLATCWPFKAFNSSLSKKPLQKQ